MYENCLAIEPNARWQKNNSTQQHSIVVVRRLNRDRPCLRTHLHQHMQIPIAATKDQTIQGQDFN